MRPSQRGHPKQSPFIKKSLHQRLKEQDLSIRNSSPQQLQKSLESCQKTLATSGFPETSETAIILKQFESKILTRLNQLSQSSNEAHLTTDPTPSTSTSTNTYTTPFRQNENQMRSIGPEGIVGFKRRLIQEQSFVPTSDSLLAGMSMSQSIKLQEQNLYRERELANMESLSRLSIQSSGLNSRTCEHRIQQANEFQAGCGGEEEEEDDEDILFTKDDEPDVQRAWELAYQAGFTRGPDDLPRRMSPAD